MNIKESQITFQNYMKDTKMIESKKRYIREIHNDYKHLVKYKCYKCGAFPVIEEGPISTYDGDFDSYISCPNEECYNSVPFNDRLSKAISLWNKHNIPKFEPKSKPKRLNNCLLCEHKIQCIYSRNIKEEYLKDKKCDDFKKRPCRIYTSYFFNSREYEKLYNVQFVSIAGKEPENFKNHILYFPETYKSYKQLAPKYVWWKKWHDENLSNEWYIQKYNETVLSKLDPQNVYNDLTKDGKDVVLLCWEEDPNEFCHRHLVAEWLNKNLNIEVEEL